MCASVWRSAIHLQVDLQAEEWAKESRRGSGLVREFWRFGSSETRDLMSEGSGRWIAVDAAVTVVPIRSEVRSLRRWVAAAEESKWWVLQGVYTTARGEVWCNGRDAEMRRAVSCLACSGEREDAIGGATGGWAGLGGQCEGDLSRRCLRDAQLGCRWW